MRFFFIVYAIFGLHKAFAIENARVLPVGVRNVNLRTVNTNMGEKTDDAGVRQPLAKPLSKDLTFENIAKSESPLASKQLQGFLLTEGIAFSDSVGVFTADLKGQVGVTAGIFSYGLLPKLTLAVGIPYYQAETDIAVGFQTKPAGQRFLDALARPEVNQLATAKDVGNKLNHAVERLNEKLRDHGFRSLESWQGEGLGDVTLAGKYQIYQGEPVLFASTTGIVLPTGKIDDPDILNDIPFGDGQTDLFAQLSTDQVLGWNFTLNEFAKYTVQLPGERRVRLATAKEAIEVESQDVAFKLGDKMDAGVSLRLEPASGLVAGFGYLYFRKFGDRYEGVAQDVEEKLVASTHQQAHSAEAQIGYSTVPLFQRKAFAVPMEMKFSLTRPLYSQNMPVTRLAQFDLNLFF